MTSREVVVRLDRGFETRPVAMLVQVASQFDSNVYIESENRRVNAKSIMGMMTLGFESGAEITVCANGADEEEAVAAIENYLTQEA